MRFGLWKTDLQSFLRSLESLPRQDPKWARFATMQSSFYHASWLETDWHFSKNRFVLSIKECKDALTPFTFAT